MSPSDTLNVPGTATGTPDSVRAPGRPVIDPRLYAPTYAPGEPSATPRLHFSIELDEQAGVYVAMSAEVAAHAEGSSPEAAVGALVDRLHDLRAELEADQGHLSPELQTELEVLRASLRG